MTVRLSPQKVSKIMRCYFTGVHQPSIAKKVRVDQSTVSLYASRFKERVKEVGLLTAGKEFGVLEEVDALRSLSVELSEANLTAEDARQGLKIMRAFIRLGVDPEQHATLIKVCGKIADPGFVQATLKLTKIETEGNMTYEEVISRFETVTSELPPAENRLRGIQAKLKSLNSLIAQRNSELTNLEAQLVQLRKGAKAKEAKLEQEFDIKMKKLNVQYKEVEEVAALKAELAKKGLNLKTVLKLAKEF